MWCKVRTIASLDNEYGFRMGRINLRLYAEKTQISKYAGKTFGDIPIDELGSSPLYDGQIRPFDGYRITELCELVSRRTAFEYVFDPCMFVDGEVKTNNHSEVGGESLG